MSGPPRLLASIKPAAPPQRSEVPPLRTAKRSKEKGREDGEPEGGAGGERRGEPRGRSPTKPPSGAETARQGLWDAGALCDNERSGAFGGTTRAKAKLRGYGRGFGRCTAAASQSDCKRVPEAAKKENSRDLTCRSREFLVQCCLQEMKSQLYVAIVPQAGGRVKAISLNELRFNEIE